MNASRPRMPAHFKAIGDINQRQAQKSSQSFTRTGQLKQRLACTSSNISEMGKDEGVSLERSASPDAKKENTLIGDYLPQHQQQKGAEFSKKYAAYMSSQKIVCWDKLHKTGASTLSHAAIVRPTRKSKLPQNLVTSDQQSAKQMTTMPAISDRSRRFSSREVSR